MSTKKLAKELGLLRQRSKSSSESKKSVLSNQIFSYLIVIDFESTCWREKNSYGQEIIEFPAVLLNTSTGEIESEFHTYVQPQEHPILSEFCTELTGITQTQVEAGVPLQICLSQFSRWLRNLQLEKEVVFPNKQQKSSAPSPSQKLCTFLTWSDWDLGVCLQYECKRKQLHKPGVLNSWIDLRSTYRLFYCRKPKGLNGALQDLGIQFSGREHSGLDDSRNTARLAARMMVDGCIMKITRSLERTPVVVNPILGKTTSTADSKKELSNINEKENMPSTSKPPSSKTHHRDHQRQPPTKKLDPKENSSSAQDSVQICHSLISPKTLLNSTTSSMWGHSRRLVTADGAAHLSSVMKNATSTHNNINSLVLCSTTVNCFSSPLQPNPASETGTTSGPEEEEDGGEFLVEMEERCGSYDDVVLEGGDDTDGTQREYDSEFTTDFDGCFESKKLNKITVEEKRQKHSIGKSIKIKQNNSDSPENCKSARTLGTNINSSFLHKERVQRSSIMESETCFAVPKSITRHKTESKKQPQLQDRADWSHKICNSNTPSSMMRKPFVPVKTSTPFARPKPVTTQQLEHKESLRSSFTIYADPTKQARTSSRSSLGASLHSFNNITNTHSSFTGRSFVSAKGVQKVTSPLCVCGRRAKRQVVSNGGPNQGRGFFCCPVRRSGGSNGRVEKGCQFFKWESALMKSFSVASPAVGSSTSFFQTNSTHFAHPANKSSLRKSY